MMLNPKEIIETWIISWLGISEEKQVQQNGIDLTVNSIFTVENDEPCILTEKERKRPINNKLEKTEYNWEKGWMLKAWKIYDVLFNEDIKIPWDASWMIMQRSSLNRMWCFITTGWWDSWFENKVWGIIRPSLDIFIGENTRLAQFIAFKSDSASMYDWIYKKK